MYGTALGNSTASVAVKSAGLTARLNLFGVLVLQADYAKPLDRERRKPILQVNLLTGF